MILDTSAIIALVFEEPGFEDLLEKVAATPACGIGAPTLVETGIVLSARLGRDGAPLLARMLQELVIEAVPFLEAHWAVAVRAFGEFGKGRHPAALNLGDCMSYATARVAGLPLLCVGEDFPRTDLEIA